jgi:hypothetical protein
VGCVWAPRLTAENAQELGELGLSVDLFAAYFAALEIAFVAVSAAIGAAIFWRKSEDRMALLVSLMLITLGASLTVPYPLVDLPFVWRVSAEAVSFVGSASTILFLYLFPDGHFVPRWTRWLAIRGYGVLPGQVLCSYIYLPRLKDRDVLLRAIQDGISTVVSFTEFAYAEAYDEQTGRHVGLRVGGGSVVIDSSSVLVKPDVAQA